MASVQRHVVHRVPRPAKGHHTTSRRIAAVASVVATVALLTFAGPAAAANYYYIFHFDVFVQNTTYPGGP